MHEDQFGEFVSGYWGLKGKRLLNSYFPFKIFVFVFLVFSFFLKLLNNAIEIRLSLVILMKVVSFGRCKVMEMMKTYCNYIARDSDER